MSSEYIVIDVNHFEGETVRTKYKNLESLEKDFDQDREILEVLLSKEVYEWVWGVIFLIKLDGYDK